jgi:hypothetical protein
MKCTGDDANGRVREPGRSAGGFGVQRIVGEIADVILDFKSL